MTERTPDLRYSTGHQPVRPRKLRGPNHFAPSDSRRRPDQGPLTHYAELALPARPSGLLPGQAVTDAITAPVHVPSPCGAAGAVSQSGLTLGPPFRWRPPAAACSSEPAPARPRPVPSASYTASPKDSAKTRPPLRRTHRFPQPRRCQARADHIKMIKRQVCTGALNPTCSAPASCSTELLATI